VESPPVDAGRDLRELFDLEKRRELQVFVRRCALRTGQVLNLAELVRDAGVSASTARHWIGVLEDGFLVRFVNPYFANRTQRLSMSGGQTSTTIGVEAIQTSLLPSTHAHPEALLLRGRNRPGPG
jgi:hypothetical protein